MAQGINLTRRAFLKAVGTAPIVLVGTASAPLIISVQANAQGVDGNLCLRLALRACARTIVLGPKAFAACVAAWYAACIALILR